MLKSRRALTTLATLVALGAPGLAGAQLFETDFDDLDGWEAGWPGDPWRVSRGYASPAVAATCAEALGVAYAADPGCAFGGLPEPHDDVLSVGDKAWGDYRLTARFVTYDEDAIGFVVRHQDPQNYYLLLQSRGTFPTASTPARDARGVTTRLYRVRDGLATQLATADVAFTPQVHHLIRVDAVGPRITVWFDVDGDERLRADERLLTFVDAAPHLRGRVGLWAYDNAAFLVDRLEVQPTTPPPAVGPLRVTRVDRAGTRLEYAFDVERPASGYVRWVEGACADVGGPAARGDDAGFGAKITGALATRPDTDYCLRPCAADASGETCGDAVDASTRGVVIDTRGLSPGHWDLFTADGREHLDLRRTGTRVATAARVGRYALRVNGRALPFGVDARGRVVLDQGTLDGRAVSLDGALAITGLPVVLDMRRQPADARWAVFAADHVAAFGAYVGAGQQALGLLPGAYLWRVGGVDRPFELLPDGSVQAAPGGLAVTARNTLRADATPAGEPVAFRVRVANTGDHAWLGAGLLNGRGARAGDDTAAVFTGLGDYARGDATAEVFRNLADSLGYSGDAYAGDRVDDTATVDVLVWPDNPRLAFVGDVDGAQGDLVAGEAVVFAGAEPVEGATDLWAHDADGGEGPRPGYVTAGAGPVGRLEWRVLARVSTPGAIAVESIDRAGARARVRFTTDRPANAAVQYVAATCAAADWDAAREVALGQGEAFAGDLELLPNRRYCLRARAFNEAGSRLGPEQSLATFDLSVDATALSGLYRVQVPGTNDVEVIAAGAVRADLSLRMGTYLFDQGGDALRVDVDKDGLVRYDAALEGLLEGAGTTRLGLRGAAVRFDATTVSGLVPLAGGRGLASALALGRLEGGATAERRLLPGDFWVVHGEPHAFHVGRDGVVTTGDAAALRGGPESLTLLGRALSLDLLPVPGRAALAGAAGDPAHLELEGGRSHAVGLLPGTYALAVAGTRSALTVGAAGVLERVQDPLAFRACLDAGGFARGSGQGTATLTVRAEACAITVEVVCTRFCGDGAHLFQVSEGIGEFRATVRYASGRPLRRDDLASVSFDVDGGALAAPQADTVDGVATVGYTAPAASGGLVARARHGELLGSRAFVVIPMRDLNAPVVRPGGRVTAEQTSFAGTPLRLDAPEVSDDRDPAPTVESDAPATFPPGRTVVTWRARDFSGNTALATQEVVVVDTTPPALRAPATVDVEANGAAGTLVELPEVRAEDVADPSPEITRSGPARFSVGETRVTWTARDDAGNTAEAHTLVRVLDRTPPRLLFGADGEIVLEQTHTDGARGVDLPRPAVVDDGDPSPTVNHNAPATLPPGLTPVTFVARDRSGNESRARVGVRVVDSTAPRLEVRDVPAGWVAQARLRVETFDAADLRPEVVLEPQPDAVSRDGGAVTAQYTTEGALDVAVQALDDAGNRTSRVLPAFGVDRTPPRLRVDTRLPAADPDDEGAWPVVHVGERLALRVDAADAGADATSGVARVRMVLDPDGAAPTLLDHAEAARGAVLPAGPRAVRGLGCASAALCGPDGAVLGRALGAGPHAIEVSAVDHAGNAANLRIFFRVLDLTAALRAARDAALDEAARRGLANEGAAALHEAADRLRVAADLALGQPTGAAAPLDLTGGVIRQAQRAVPALDRAARFGADVAPIAALVAEALYWAVTDFGQVGTAVAPAVPADYEAARDVYLAAAREGIDAGDADGALANLADAYFLFGNALRPSRAVRFRDARDAIADIHAQMALYVAVAGRPGREVLAPAVEDLTLVRDALDAYMSVVGDLQDEAQVLRRLDQIDSRAYLGTLLQLRNAALQMQSASQQDVFIRGWGFGLVQAVELLSRLGLARSVFVAGPADADDVLLLQEAQGLSDEAAELIERRRVDRFLELFLRPRTDCVIVLVHNRAFDPAWPMPEACR